MYELHLIRERENFYLFRVKGKGVWFVFVDKSDLEKLVKMGGFIFV